VRDWGVLQVLLILGDVAAKRGHQSRSLASAAQSSEAAGSTEFRAFSYVRKLQKNN